MASNAREQAAREFDRRLREASAKNAEGESDDRAKAASDEFDRRLAKSGAGPAPRAASERVTPGDIAASLKDTVLAVPRFLGKLPVVTLGDDETSPLSIKRGAKTVGEARGQRAPDGEKVKPQPRPVHSPLAEETVRSAQRTGGRIIHPSRIARDYSKDPVGTALEDAANLSVLFSGGAAAAGKAAKLAAAAEATTTAARAAKVAAAAGKAAKATEAVANLPIKPYVAAAKRVGPLADAVARSQTPLGHAIRTAGLDPDSRLLKREAITPGTERMSEATGAAVEHGQNLAKLLPSADEQAAMFLVGEGEAGALAAARALLPDGEFDLYVRRTYDGAVPRSAVDLAADVIEGKAPEVKARIDQALQLHREHQAPRSKAYYESGVPGRAEQAGFEPIPAAVEKRTARLQKVLARAERQADIADARATKVADRAAEIERRRHLAALAQGARRADSEQAALDRAVARQEQRSVEAIDRLTSAEDLAVARKVRREEPTLTPAQQKIVERVVRFNEAAADAFSRGSARTLDARQAARRAEGDAAQRFTAGSHEERRALREGAAAQERAGQQRRVARLESRRLGELIRRSESGVEVQVPAVGDTRTRWTADSAQRAATQARERATRLGDALKAAESSAKHDVMSAPARLRPALARNREVASLLVEQENALRKAGLHEQAKQVARVIDELPTTLARLKAAGADFEYFAHMKIEAKPSRAGVRGALPRIVNGRETKLRTGSPRYERTIPAKVKAEIDDLRNAIATETAQKIATMPFAKRYASIENARADGYVPWDPKSPFEVSSNVTRTTTFIPEHLHKSFRSYFKDARWEEMLGWYDKGTQAFKVAVLPLNPAWQTGNVFGGLLMAAIEEPRAIWKGMRDALDDYMEHGKFTGPRRLYTANPTHEEFAFLNASVRGPESKLAKAIKAPGRGVGAVARKGYALNAWVDDLYRTATYMSKVERGVDPERAVRESLRALGDFSRMGPRERSIVRRLIPFWAWQRHVTSLAWTLPRHHPLRTAWTLHLAETFGEDEFLDGLPEYQRGMVRVGDDTYLGTGGINPFEQIGGPLFNPSNLPRSLNPIIKFALENAPGSPARGRNLFTGRDYTRPTATGRHDEIERAQGTPPSIVEQGRRMVPAIRLADAIRGRDQVARYETGDPYITGRGLIETPERDGKRALLKFLGFPLRSEKELAELKASIDTRRRQNERARRKREARERRVSP